MEPSSVFVWGPRPRCYARGSPRMALRTSEPALQPLSVSKLLIVFGSAKLLRKRAMCFSAYST